MYTIRFEIRYECPESGALFVDYCDSEPLAVRLAQQLAANGWVNVKVVPV